MVVRHSCSLAIGAGLALVLLTGLVGGVPAPWVAPLPPEDEPEVRFEFDLEDSFHWYVDSGEPTDIEVTLLNRGGVEAITTYTLSINGSTIEERELLLPRKSSRTITVSVPAMPRGSYLLNGTATYDTGITNQTHGMLFVGEPEPETLRIDVNDSSIGTTEMAEYFVMSVFPPSDAQRPIGTVATVTAADPDVASVRSQPAETWEYGVVQGASPGRTILLVEYGGVQNSTPLIVGGRTLSLTVDEGPVEQADATDLRAVLEFVDGSQIDVTEEATISSTNASIATVTGGQVVGNATGNTTLEATYEAFSTTTSVRVVEQTAGGTETAPPADDSAGLGSIAAILALAIVIIRRQHSG